LQEDEVGSLYRGQDSQGEQQLVEPAESAGRLPLAREIQDNWSMIGY
jgi:hypothetical protein